MLWKKVARLYKKKQGNNIERADKNFLWHHEVWNHDSGGRDRADIPPTRSGKDVVRVRTCLLKLRFFSVFVYLFTFFSGGIHNQELIRKTCGSIAETVSALSRLPRNSRKYLRKGKTEKLLDFTVNSRKKKSTEYRYRIVISFDILWKKIQTGASLHTIERHFLPIEKITKFINYYIYRLTVYSKKRLSDEGRPFFLFLKHVKVAT